ncbi:Dual specificity protein phosphatase 10 [Polyrhizophydium stewartii]|uniref:protein-tyrosine-phosphatase n=1 Tax=Polyrhizophydium stewartii TaxID=2732419 RepID=A0ABR4MW84_9FUNG
MDLAEEGLLEPDQTLTRADTTISAHALVALLAAAYMRTLVLDVTTTPGAALPGARAFNFLEHYRPVVASATTDGDGNGFTSPNLAADAPPSAAHKPPAALPASLDLPAHEQLASLLARDDDEDTQEDHDDEGQDLGHGQGGYDADHHPPDLIEFDRVDSSIFRHRIGNVVVVLDEEGGHDGFAAHIAALLRREGLCRAAVFLSGGLRQLAALYPSLLLPCPPPESTATLNANFLQSLAGLADTDPVGDLRERQNQLVQAVWFGSASPPDTPQLIVPDFLYLASCLAATRELLASNKITHVIRLGWGFTNHCAPEDGVKYHDFEIGDCPTVPIHTLFDETTSIIEKARRNGERVLVHCHAGVSRSSTIVLAYMIRYMHMSLYDAWNTTYKIRPIIRPNEGFAKALQDYEIEHFGQPNATMSVFWMSDSYLFYINYVDFMYRLAGLRSAHALATA